MTNMSGPSEVELKLVATTGRLARVRRLFPGARFTRATVDSVYFDTRDCRLQRKGMVLRVRRDGDRWLQTLKMEDGDRTLVAQRGEWEVDLGAIDERPPPQLDAFAGTPLMQVLGAGFQPTDLIPVFRTRFVRRRATVRHRGSSIEVAIDEGELEACGAARARRQPIAEVELELKSGHVADVLHLAQRIVGQAEPVLVPALRSKAERGYALAGAVGLSVVRASAPAFTQPMSPHLTRRQALRRVVSHALGIVVANVDALRGTPALEHVHQARVALRRLRSAVRLFDKQHVDFPRRLASEFRWFAQVLGDLRDWDVLAGSTLPDIFASGHTGTARGRELTNWARRRRKRALQVAVAAAGSRRYARLVLAAARWAVSEPPPAEATLVVEAAALAEALADDLTAGAASFVTRSRRGQHQVRIKAKRLRYALDLLRVAMPQKATGGYIDALADLQDNLGDLSDVAVAWKRLRKRKLKRTTVARLKEWHAAIAPALARKTGRALAAFARRSRPWVPPPA